jgi:hypothetical protein
LPRQITLNAADGKSSQDFRLGEIRMNKPIDQRYFELVNPGKPWKVERNPGGQPPVARSFRRQSKDRAAQ